MTDLARRPISLGRNSRNRSQPHTINLVGLSLSDLKLEVSTDCCRVPPNVKFEIDDCEEEWTFTQPWDYIHSRYMIGSIRNWPRLIAQSFTHVVPGGWVEYHDFDARYYSEDGSLLKDSPIDSWVTTWMKASNDAGRDPQPGPKLFGWLQEAGFINVKQERYRLPIGPWPKDSQLVSPYAF